MLTISLQTLAFIIAKARGFEAEVPPVDEDSGSNAADDGETDVLEDRADNPTEAELRGALDQLNSDEKDEMLALVYLGRGDFTADEWPAALTQAREQRNGRETDTLVGIPLLADYLEDAIAELGISIEDFEIDRM